MSLNIQSFLKNVNHSLTSAEYRLLSLDKRPEILFITTYATSLISFKFIEFPFLKWTNIIERLKYKAIGEPFRCNLLSLLMFPAFYSMAQVYNLYLYRYSDAITTRLVFLCMISPEFFVASQIGSYLKRSSPNIPYFRIPVSGMIFSGTLNALSVALFFKMEQLNMSYLNYLVMATGFKLLSFNSYYWLMAREFENEIKNGDRDFFRNNVSRLRMWYVLNNCISLGIIGKYYFGKQLY